MDSFVFCFTNVLKCLKFYSLKEVMPTLKTFDLPIMRNRTGKLVLWTPWKRSITEVTFEECCSRMFFSSNLHQMNLCSTTECWDFYSGDFPPFQNKLNLLN